MKPGTPRNPSSLNAPLKESSVHSDEMLVTASASRVAQRIVNSRQLFSTTNEVLIEHAGLTYRLRITQANKLILTK